MLQNSIKNEVHICDIFVKNSIAGQSILPVSSRYRGEVDF